MGMSDYGKGADDVQLVPGSIVGYRAWSPAAVDGMTLTLKPELGSVARGYTWTRGINNAICMRGRVVEPHSSPSSSCSCGFYARLYDDHHGYDRHMGAIGGVVEASGRIVLGTKGFRAERATVKALYLFSEGEPWHSIYRHFWADGVGSRMLTSLSESYQVPVLTSFREARAAFPPSDVSALMPKGKDQHESNATTYWAGQSGPITWTPNSKIRIIPLKPDGSPA